MSINNVNNLNKADLVKLALAKKSGQTTSANQPSYMTKNGSVFNAPDPGKTKATTTKSTAKSDVDTLNNAQKSYENIDKLKTTKDLRNAISDLENDMQGMNFLEKASAKMKLKKLNEKKSDVAKQEYENSMTNLKSIASGKGTSKSSNSSKAGSANATEGGHASVSEGKQMAKEAKGDQTSAKEGRAQTEKNTQQMNTLSKKSTKLNKDLKKSEKSFNKQIQQGTKEVQSNQAKILKETQSMNDAQMEIASMQSELQSLTADSTGMGEKSAFSLKLAGEDSNPAATQKSSVSSVSSSGGDEKRIQELSQKIGQKSDAMTASGANIQKLQAQTGKRIATMNRVTLSQSKYYLKQQKGLEANQKTSDKILKVADKIDNISQTVSQVGQITQKVGKGMIIAGQAMTSNPFTAAAGAALISAGGVAEKVGTVTELVGNYGSAAANVTKAACNAANGNFAAALQSAGSAIQSGAAAAKGTKELDKSFKGIDDQVKNAQDQLAAGTAAKQAAKDLEAKGGLEGMTKKQAAAGMKEEMLGKIQNGEVNGKDLLNQVKDKKTIGQAAGTAQGTFGTVSSDFGKAELTGQASLLKNGKELSDKNIKKSTNSAYKDTLAQKKNTRLGTGSLTNPIKAKSSPYDNAMKLGQVTSNVGTAAAKMGLGSQQGGRTQTAAQRHTTSSIPTNNKMLARGNRLIKRGMG